MRSKLSLFLGLAATLLVATAAPAFSQSSMDPGQYSAQPSIDESFTTTESSTTLSSTDFRLVWVGMWWSQLAWMPVSPMYSTSTLSIVNLGDRRWGLR